MNKIVGLAIFLLSMSLPFVAIADAGLKDPTRPLSYQDVVSSAKQELKLQAIFFQSSGESSAIINGRLLGVGQELSQWQVVSISKEEVQLRSKLGRKTLRLHNDYVR